MIAIGIVAACKLVHSGVLDRIPAANRAVALAIRAAVGHPQVAWDNRVAEDNSTVALALQAVVHHRVIPRNHQAVPENKAVRKDQARQVLVVVKRQLVNHWDEN